MIRAFLNTLAATAFVLVLSGGLYAAAGQQTDPPSNPFANDTAAIPAGMAIYNVTCAACHGTAGMGGSGPALNGHLQHGDSDADIFQTIRSGVDGTEMPSFDSLSIDNSWRLVAYLKSLSARPAPAPPQTTASNAKAGESLFFGKGGCTACHEINGSGMDLASGLSAEGLKPVAAIRNGVAHAPMRQRFVTVVMADGTRLSGIITAEDLFTLHLKQRDGKFSILGKAALRSVTEADNPLLPPHLSDSETGDIVAYLAAQKARNLADTVKLVPAPVLPYARLAANEPRNWATHRGALDGGNFSALNQITAANARQIQARWSAGLDGTAASIPLVVDGILYVSGASGSVQALDARSGLAIWRFAHQPVLNNPGPVSGNRGVAILDGRVFVGTADNKLIALDAHNGRELWEKQTASTLDGYAMTGAPLALRTRIIVGVAGSGPKARGWLDAYDPATGARLWRFESVAAAQAAGAMTQSVGAYEAANVMLYWSTSRASDDGLYGDSILALNGNSGAVVWQHRLKPGAGGGNVVLTEQSIGGRRHALLLYLGRDGLLTALDRADGKTVQEKTLSEAILPAAPTSFDRSSAILYAGLGGEVAAIDLRASRVLWRVPVGATISGVLATRGGTLFASLGDGQLIGLDMKTGKPVWNFRAAGAIAAPPVTYSVGGKQFVAVTAANTLTAFSLPE